MTEAEWLACEQPDAMLRHLGAKISGRKLRLFAFACCRRMWNFVRDERLQTALDVLERYADKQASDKQRLEARKGIAAFRAEYYEESGREEEICIGTELWNASTKTRRRVADTCGEGAAAAFAWADVSEYNRRLAEERGKQADPLRDIFGNPFRPVAVDPSWLTSDVLTLAEGIYQERSFDRMPILADALQDADCDNDDILTHCRDAKQNHVRGCWVVDLVLDKK